MTDEAISWIATTGTVTSCRFQFAGLSTLIVGFNTRGKFRITFDYYAHGRLYSDEFQSQIAIPQGESISLTYNPLDPAQNSRTNRPTEGPATGPPTWLIGVGGSIMLSLLWLMILRGCR